MSDDDKIIAPLDPVTRESRPEADDDMPKIGDWFWVTSKNYKGEEQTWLGCVMDVGSNYAELHQPHGDSGYATIRVHVDEFDAALKAEPNALEYIARQTARHQGEVNRLMGEVSDLYASLGIETPKALADHSGAPSTAVATLSAEVDVKRYETALVTAKKETLPKLFERIATANKEMARWMQAPMLPLMAKVGPLKNQIEGINDRIFNISLYAGLTEQVELVNPGAEPAAIDERLHVMQRRLFMDEEALLEYESGGMEFKNIRAFDAWLSKPDNRDRLLPFPRTIAAFRVRRNEKERDSEGSIIRAFINFEIAQADTLTFLYIRNGAQVWRMSCDMDFGPLIFPEVTSLDPGEPMMVKMSGSHVDRMMARSQYDYWTAKWQETEMKRRAWNLEHPKDAIRNPHGFLGAEVRDDNGQRFSFEPGQWRPFDHTNVYYDEAMKNLARQIREYNRVALIIQGLFDRSEVLHPHRPVRSWTAEGFESAIKLVYDGSAVLYAGEKPDFEAFRAKLNASLGFGSVVVGADDYWSRKMGAQETKRRENDWRDKTNYRPTHFRPYGDPGPGRVATIAEWQPRARKATFRWMREARAGRWGTMLPASITVPASALLNISAYTPGDFKQFYRDPRTRADYLKWAWLLLTAEDYHGGKLRPDDTQD